MSSSEKPYNVLRDSPLRYLGFTNDVGEALRGVIPPWAVWSTYGVTGAYALGDVAQLAWREHRRGAGWPAVHRQLVDSAVFHGLATVAVTPLIIAGACRAIKAVVPNALPGWARRFGPSAVGIALIPLIVPPTDRYVEHLIERWRGHQTADKADA